MGNAKDITDCTHNDFCVSDCKHHEDVWVGCDTESTPGPQTEEPSQQPSSEEPSQQPSSEEPSQQPTEESENGIDLSFEGLNLKVKLNGVDFSFGWQWPW